MPLSNETRAQIDDLVQNNNVVLFMKGRKTMPQCGFSAQVVSVLGELVDDYTTVNVLDSMELREGIKAYSSWPTIPQLYVNGKFIGGCDIVTAMFDNGELHALFGKAVEEVAAPTLNVTEAAASALKEALASEKGVQVRFVVDAAFRPGLDLTPPKSGDLKVQAAGLEILVDRGSAKRSDGVKIDFVPGAQGGFKIENPNQPPQVKQITPAEVQAKIERGEAFEFLDARSDEEQQIAKIEGAKLLTQAVASAVEQMDKDTTLVVHCHHGGRSQAAAEHFVQKGFRNVYNMKGGIDAWSLMVDNTVPRY